ncbi:MAG: LacI family DNA-binding transcriptional regulator [Propionibacteriaceae bacterium]|nr:LacI family DNA-binding transcriptional regulator [Propionibacteriaceae bacterium]
MKVTLKDVAARAGVSEATASKAVNGRGDIADATRSAVLDAAAALGYFPAKRLDPVTARSTITAITDAIDPSYGVEVLRGLVEEGDRRGIDIVPHIESETVEPSRSPNEWEATHLAPRSIGIVTMVYRARGPVFEVARRRGIPVIAIDPYVVSKDADVTISATNWEGGKLATEHLLELGHRRIALINGLSEFLPGIERMHGYRAALEEAGVSAGNDNLIFDGRYTFGSGFDAAEEIMRLPDPPTAVFALSDRMALGAIRAFETHGVRVPADISVIGFDNSPGAELMTPALTTIAQPLSDMGRLAVRTLQDMSAGHPATSTRIKLATSLVVRSSTAPPVG